MEKKGQFYLLATIIIITLISGFATVINYSKPQTNINIDYLGEELIIESEKVLDYGLNNNVNLKNLIGDFNKRYINHSNVDNAYFIFGTKGNLTIAGYKKLSSGTITYDVGSGNQVLNLNKGVYGSSNFLNPDENISITSDGVVYDFTLKTGENFYYILSKEIEEEVYIVTNSYSGISGEDVSSGENESS
tara:strand:+ start:846 stop:1415 length:570 start_codon:yes stop_codon:yes gene_type:complete